MFPKYILGIWPKTMSAKVNGRDFALKDTLQAGRSLGLQLKNLNALSKVI